jgi:hypothetical protein
MAQSTRHKDGTSDAVKGVNLSALGHHEIEESVNEIRIIFFVSPSQFV